LGYIALLHFLKFNSTYIISLITDLIFALIIIVFLLFNFKSLKETLIPKISNYKLLIIVSFSLCVLAFLVTHFADFLNQSVFNTNNSSYYEHYKDSPSPLLLCIISVGVFPAIFEEIAFRGILFNELKNIMSVNATIIITTVLFTILHFSFISFLWIFPIGFLFGYLRSKYNNLIYGIIGHFVYNSSIVLIEYFNL
jgi:membrane protease YdiL (CAAX protease family)